jgi:hypothetical protein
MHRTIYPWYAKSHERYVLEQCVSLSSLMKITLLKYINGETIERLLSEGTAQPALQGKSHLCIPFLGIARPHSQFLNSSAYEQFMYIFPAAE